MDTTSPSTPFQRQRRPSESSFLDSSSTVTDIEGATFLMSLSLLCQSRMSLDAAQLARAGQVLVHALDEILVLFSCVSLPRPIQSEFLGEPNEHGN